MADNDTNPQLTDRELLLKTHWEVGQIKSTLTQIRENMVTRVEHADMKRRVGSLEKTRSWGAYLIVGAVIVTLLGLIGLNADGYRRKLQRCWDAAVLYRRKRALR